MSKFEVGDRVKVLESNNRRDLHGSLGVVLHIKKNIACIEFDKNIGAISRLEGVTGKDGHCWNIILNDLELAGYYPPKVNTTWKPISEIKRIHDYPHDDIPPVIEDKCSHNWEIYTGLSDSFEHCSVCGMKKSEYKPSDRFGFEDGGTIFFDDADGFKL